MPFGNVPPGILAGAVEKLLAKTDEDELAAFYQRELSAMPADVFAVFLEAMFEAFRERGESSEDAAEGAGTTLERIAARESGAPQALLAYARSNPDLIRESTALFVERRPDLIETLPSSLQAALADRLAEPAT
ncbi:MAG: hypothetical protein JO030_07150 [Candidatus Eremiobacteraeota bacterium]|nr:hypothetical protein [Candidatus Eremiobacteraeota bacterium]